MFGQSSDYSGTWCIVEATAYIWVPQKKKKAGTIKCNDQNAASLAPTTLNYT